MQQRLPDVGARLVDQRDLRLLRLPERVAERGRQLEPAGPAADDHDVMQARAGALDRAGPGRVLARGRRNGGRLRGGRSGRAGGDGRRRARVVL